MQLKPKQEQEKKYFYPYHWSIKPINAPVYFGYLSIIVKLVRKHQKLNKNSNYFLDAGCGDGFSTNYLNKQINGKWIGIDYSKKACAMASLMVDSDVNIKNQDLRKTEFDDCRFCVVTLIEVLEHLPIDNCHSAVNELYRILDWNGILVVSVPSNNIKVHYTHIQHFDLEKLNALFLNRDLFVLKEVIYQNHLIARRISKLLSNKFYDIKIFSKFFNILIYPRLFNKVKKFKQAGRLIVVYAKKRA